MWRAARLDTAARRFASPRVLQGNLDPALLFAVTDVVRSEVARIKAEAKRAMEEGTATGHIFNLGHGVLPTTDADTVTEAVRIIHETHETEA